MEPSTEFEQRTDLTAVQQGLDRIREETGKVLVGQDESQKMLLAALLANGHVLIEGVPGLAKTLMARALAAVCGVKFSRIQFTPDLMPADITGTSIFSPRTQEFVYHKGPVFSNFVLVDEINRAPAKTQSALFEVMEERTVSSGGDTFTMEEPFFVLATQNPVEHEGTYRLPEAQVDRFLFKLTVDYPNTESETLMLRAHHGQPAFDKLKTLKPVVSASLIVDARRAVQKVHVEDQLFDYIVELTTKTRNHRLIQLGASPRASIALLNASKALAIIDGRDFATPEDIQQAVVPVFRHRIMLTAEAEIEGRTIDSMLQGLLNAVTVPR
ncbi:MAG: MoxR family ATPase [Balneolales bacterium]|nr:MoxR family ATPase [Balneolales bacterium]